MSGVVIEAWEEFKVSDLQGADIGELLEHDKPGDVLRAGFVGKAAVIVHMVRAFQEALKVSTHEL